jgi:hypothetical protein
MVSDGDKSAVTGSTVDGDGPERVEPDAVSPEGVEPDAVGPDPVEPDVESPAATGPEAVMPATAEAAPPTAGQPGVAVGARSRRPLVGLGVVALVLAIAVAAVAVMFARERSAHDDTRRALRAEAARAAQLERDLAAVRAERAEFEKKLAAAEAQVLSTDAKAAIANCVKFYATLERAVEDAERNGVTSGGVELVPFVVPENGSPLKVCDAAEKYLAKIG